MTFWTTAGIGCQDLESELAAGIEGLVIDGRVGQRADAAGHAAQRDLAVIRVPVLNAPEKR
jgi:hypothetical protein